jgi:hypothetical protein
MALMGYREYARHRGCTLKAVQKAIKTGRIPASALEMGNGNRQQINSDLADAAWVENTDPAKQSLMYGAGPAAPAGVQTPAANATPADPAEEDLEEDLPPLPPGAPEDETSKDYRKARAQREQLRLAREQREFDIEGGKLLPLEDAQRVAFTAFRQLRDAILHVPARVKDAAAAETNPDVIERLLEGELSAALGSFDPGTVLREPEDPDDEQVPE